MIQDLSLSDSIRSNDFEDLLTELSATFVNVSPDELDSRITEGLKRIVLFLGVDRSTLVQFDKETDLFRVTHSWAVDGIDPLPTTLDSSSFPHVTHRIREGEQIVFSRITDMPPTVRQDKEALQRIDLKSVAMVPLKGAGEILGAISFGSIRKARKWPKRFIQRLELIGELFANALLQRQKELDLNKALAEVSKLKERLEAENVVWREEALRSEQAEDLIGDSPAFRNLLRQIDQVARTDSTVLILGETGTGKELVATAIHLRSPRGNQPLIRVNCAALPSDLIESELFGHEKGAFTGALARKIGRFELADGGTIVLDEIGELPGELQAKLLRVLQSGEFERLGSTKTRYTDARVIASTNRDLKTMVAKGTFRSDLFYRLHVFPITVPALRERKEDIPLLTAFFVDKLGAKLGKKIKHIPEETTNALTAHSWPGNVRELENIVERSIIVSSESSLVLDGLPHFDVPRPHLPFIESEMELSAVRPLEEIERDYIRSVCVLCDWKIHGKGNAAEKLRINPNTLRSRMKKLGIRRPV